MGEEIQLADKPEIAHTPIYVEPGSRPDEVGGRLTTKLNGHAFEYEYSTGRRYRLVFYDDRCSFQLLSLENQPVRTLSYLAREIRKDMFLVHWMVPGRSGHVALVIDLKERAVHVAALMPGQQELFDEAPIEVHQSIPA
ncbi:hypothetical protein FXB41_13575 [Bradyrhizobium canariense]|uniref:MoaF N-terminal domain-containing protein n=1 Tax=Bradyrhizobium canariense TaxID=255045 RepID=UPI001CA56E43|nr:MoaF N-terminal domain-containing protein [Bradyrhizobium canariense]MBW5435778.1 hypothetical protein [Bradyrhizobium canariense]